MTVHRSNNYGRRPLLRVVASLDQRMSRFLWAECHADLLSGPNRHITEVLIRRYRINDHLNQDPITFSQLSTIYVMHVLFSHLRHHPKPNNVFSTTYRLISNDFQHRLVAAQPLVDG